MVESFKFKVWFSTETVVEADNITEARGILKGLALAQMKGFKFEKSDIMKPNIKFRPLDKKPNA